jgi:terminase small subunit / prophage DNA-packing protein
MNTISTSGFAELVGVSERSVRELLRKGIIKRDVDGGILHPEGIRSYVSHLRELAAGRGGEAAAEVASHRAALLKIQAARAQFQLDQELEKWVELTDVEAHWDSALRTLRAGVLAIPTRCSARVPGMTREMVYEMDQEIRELLTELARGGYPAPVVEESKTKP